MVQHNYAFFPYTITWGGRYLLNIIKEVKEEMSPSLLFPTYHLCFCERCSECICSISLWLCSGCNWCHCLLLWDLFTRNWAFICNWLTLSSRRNPQGESESEYVIWVNKICTVGALIPSCSSQPFCVLKPYRVSLVPHHLQNYTAMVSGARRAKGKTVR